MKKKKYKQIMEKLVFKDRQWRRGQTQDFRNIRKFLQRCQLPAEKLTFRQKHLKLQKIKFRYLEKYSNNTLQNQKSKQKVSVMQRKNVEAKTWFAI